MDVRVIFGLGALMSLLSSLVAATLYVWPWLRARDRNRALAALVTPHMFIRFFGLSLLVVGVVAPSLPSAFATPAAYGDFVAGILAIVATIGLAKDAGWAIAAVWIFNVWGTADLLFAGYEGQHVHLMPGTLGAAFYLPTALVPALLVTHLLIFGLLFRKAGKKAAKLA